MEIRERTVLVLGGAGLVGSAVCREFLPRAPARLIVGSLRPEEIDASIAELRRLFPDCATEIVGAHGNVFVRSSLKDVSRAAILADAAHRRAIIDDTIAPLAPEVLERFHLYRVLIEHRPDIVVDCVNTATALAYQDLYRSAQEVLHHLDAGHGIETFRAALERHLCTLYTPQLIRHIQVLYEGLRRAGTRAYVKIGTSGTGGMGLNIPYTHSEEKPSRVLLSKSAMAGAHTLLLFLMARTPDAPRVKEIKPTAAIAWKSLGYGPVMRGGRPIRLEDCPPERAVRLMEEPDLGASRVAERASGQSGEVLHSVYIDTGENGYFSRAEFEVVTSLGQMEFVTPEEIARNVVFEVEGISTGHDVIDALDNVSMGPTYRAGVLRHPALERLRELERLHGVSSVAFEMLGPPRLSKLLFEAEILRRTRPTLASVASDAPENLARSAEELIHADSRLRAEMISVGIPVLLGDGARLLRGTHVVIPAAWDAAEPTEERIDRWAEEGWVDLRRANFRRWIGRARSILEEIRSVDPADTSSRYDRDRRYWETDPAIDIAKVLGWVFLSEESGRRMKA